LPTEQIGFALSETFAHLRHLIVRGEIEQGIDGGVFTFVPR